MLDLLKAALEYLESDQGISANEVTHVKLEKHPHGQWSVVFPEHKIVYWASLWTDGTKSEWQFLG